MLEHIERLKTLQALDLPAGIDRQVHQNCRLKIAREGGQMTPADLVKFEAQLRYATLVALAIEGMATVTDGIIDLHDRIIEKLFNTAKNKHQQQFQSSGKPINDKVPLYDGLAKPFDPALERSERRRQAAFGHYFNGVSEAELVMKIVTHTQDDDIAVKVAAVKQPVDLYKFAHSLLALL